MHKKVGGKVPQYKIDREKGIVVAFITDCRFDALETLRKRTEFGCMEPIYISDALIKTVLMNNSYSGKAKLAPGDVFDAEKGREMAYERLKKKYESSKKKALKRHLGRLEKILFNS